MWRDRKDCILEVFCRNNWQNVDKAGCEDLQRPESDDAQVTGLSGRQNGGGVHSDQGRREKGELGEEDCTAPFREIPGQSLCCSKWD